MGLGTSWGLRVFFAVYCAGLLVTRLFQAREACCRLPWHSLLLYLLVLSNWHWRLQFAGGIRAQGLSTLNSPAQIPEGLGFEGPHDWEFALSAVRTLLKRRAPSPVGVQGSVRNYTSKSEARQFRR